MGEVTAAWLALQAKYSLMTEMVDSEVDFGRVESDELALTASFMVDAPGAVFKVIVEKIRDK